MINNLQNTYVSKLDMHLFSLMDLAQAILRLNLMLAYRTCLILVQF